MYRVIKASEDVMHFQEISVPDKKELLQNLCKLEEKYQEEHYVEQYRQYPSNPDSMKWRRIAYLFLNKNRETLLCNEPDPNKSRYQTILISFFKDSGSFSYLDCYAFNVKYLDGELISIDLTKVQSKEIATQLKELGYLPEDFIIPGEPKLEPSRKKYYNREAEVRRNQRAKAFYPFN